MEKKVKKHIPELEEMIRDGFVNLFRYGSPDGLFNYPLMVDGRSFLCLTTPISKWENVRKDLLETVIPKEPGYFIEFLHKQSGTMVDDKSWLRLKITAHGYNFEFAIGLLYNGVHYMSLMKDKNNYILYDGKERLTKHRCGNRDYIRSCIGGSGYFFESTWYRIIDRDGMNLCNACASPKQSKKKLDSSFKCQYPSSPKPVVNDKISKVSYENVVVVNDIDDRVNTLCLAPGDVVQYYDFLSPKPKFVIDRVRSIEAHKRDEFIHITIKYVGPMSHCNLYGGGQITRLYARVNQSDIVSLIKTVSH